MKIQKFDEFINEWDTKGHWNNERANLSNSLSRIVPLSPNHPDGWSCTELIELDTNGLETSNKINISDFLQLSKLNKEEFDKQVTFALNALTHSSRIDRKNYRDQKHRYVFLGKIGFPIKVEEYAPTGEKLETSKTYSPILAVKKESQGNQVWGAIRENKGITILYFKPKMTEDAIEKIGHHAYTLSDGYIDNAIYRKNLWGGIDFLHEENFVLTIPPVDNWEELVKRYADQGFKFEFPQVKNYERDEELEKWKSYMIKDATAIFDVGTLILVQVGTNFDIRKVVELNKGMNKMFLENEKGGKSMKDYPKPGDVINIVSREVPNLREDGKLPATGTLIKSMRLESFRSIKNDKGVAKNGIFGPIIDYFVFSDGTKIVSPL